MKKFLSLVLALVLVLSVAACASAETEKRTITFWHCMGGHNGELVQENVDAFNASQDEIFCQAEYSGGYDDSLIKIKAAAPAGEAPDVFHIFEMGTSYLADQSWVVPFQDMLDQDPFITLDMVAAPLRNYYTVDGKLMCIPFNPSSPIMYINQDAFDAAGITEIPTTWKEIEAIADQLVENSDVDYAMGLSVYGWFFEAMMVMAGGYYCNGENGRTETATAIEYDTNGIGELVMTTWKRLTDEGVNFNFGYDNDSARAAFMNGQTAITFESTAQLRNIVDNTDFNVTAAFLPSCQDERTLRAIIGGGVLWIVNNGDEQKIKDAWEFVKFMSSAEPAAKFSMGTGYYAANLNAYDVPEYVAYLEENPNAKVALNQLTESGECSPLSGSVFTGVNVELRQIWQEEAEKYLADEIDLETMFANCAERSNASLETYNANNQ